ncbi:MAG TPA: hypothetical protein VHE55_15480 [Fimbriimonadaceae bacterium]|nr:hypothetical protein [Fimbriimonadaceae bacterium]
MKKIITLAVAAVFAAAAVSVNAQVAGPGQKSNGVVTQRAKARNFMRSLNLTKAQKQRIKAIRDQRKSQMRMLRMSKQAPAVKKERAKAIRMDSQARVLAVLTPPQRARLQAMRAKFRANHPALKRNGGGKIKK